jgi:outer membrane protein assembly factor BamD
MNMKNIKLLSFACYFAVMVLSIGSCTNEFEKVRTSGDPKLILNKANEYFNEKDYYSAQTLYELAIQSYRGKAEAENIFYNLAYTFYHNGEFITASQYFKNFSSTYGNSPKREESDFMSAYSHYQLSPNFKLDQSYSEKSIEELEQFLNRYPSSKRVAECNKLIDEMRGKMERKSFEQGQLYYNLQEYQSATKSFENLLKDFPGSKYESESKLLLVKSSYELALKSVEDKKMERFAETVAYCKKFIGRLKDRKVEAEIKDIFEKASKKLKSIS